ncbi:MAG: hypothetical protein ACREFH_14695, partial [Stellaceae bacterium]
MLAVAGFYVLRFALFVFLIANLLHTRDLMDASAKSGRGDTPKIGAPSRPAARKMRLTGTSAASAGLQRRGECPIVPASL